MFTNIGKNKMTTYIFTDVKKLFKDYEDEINDIVNLYYHHNNYLNQSWQEIENNLKSKYIKQIDEHGLRYVKDKLESVRKETNMIP